jgi:SAM-dependent methyltransferase
MATHPQHTADIPPDEDAADTDSALGDDLSAMTQTLRSSLLESVRENGRGYHRYSSAVGEEYPLPEDEIEQARLDLQHEMMRRTFNGRLYLSPITGDLHNILDLGTGTGIWAIEMADANPQAQVLGMDLSPIQPWLVPPNVRFEVDDFNSQWTYTQPFDFIHARALVGSSQDFLRLIRQAYDHLRPGGYLEMTDVQMPIMSDDGTLEGTDLETWSNRQVEACAIMGVDTTAPSKYRQMMMDAGFEDVQEQRFKWPIGTWPRDSFFKELGNMGLINFLTGLEGFTLRCTFAISPFLLSKRHFISLRFAD